LFYSANQPYLLSAPPKIIEVSRDDFPRPVASATKVSPPSLPSGGFTDIPHTSVSKAAAGRLLQSKISIPHIYLSAQIFLNSLLKFQQKANCMCNFKQNELTLE
jgi:pyruvate/2-oxoglutarate dehydrogenase complex dihydrolipoamide acyltransferase (E2) component